MPSHIWFIPITNFDYFASSRSKSFTEDSVHELRVLNQDLLGQNDVECGCGCQMKKIAHRNESSQETATQGADSSPLCSADRRCAAIDSVDQHSERFDQDVPPLSKGRTCCLARALLFVAST